MLYVHKSLYVLMEATHTKVTAAFEDDFRDLWTEDVLEVFLGPD